MLGVTQITPLLFLSGDVVEVVTYDGDATPKMWLHHANWLEFVQVKSTKHKLTRFLKANVSLKVAAQAQADTRLEWEEASPAPPASQPADQAQRASAPQGALSLAQRSYENGQRINHSRLILHVECGDRTGLLRDVSALISRHGLFIRTYSGKPLDEDLGTCSMGFELGGNSEQIGAIVEELGSVVEMLRFQTFCTIDFD